MSVKLSDGSRKINQYRILRRLGQGMYATVHLGEFTDENGELQYVAIKEFDKRRLQKKRHMDLPIHARRNIRVFDAQDPLYLVRTEVAILKKISHKHVVRLYEALDDPDENKLFLVFENCPGGPLYQILPGQQGERFSEQKARKYFRQILSGIEYMHANGIVHHDIKPDNILMLDADTCKISDFGVSEMISNVNDDIVHRSIGTPAFMSPELCTIGSVHSHGYKDDVWAFGVTLYCLIMGRLPFYRDSLPELYESIQHEEPEMPGGDASAECHDLLCRMLDKNENTRITVKEMYTHPWVTENGTHPMPPPTSTAIEQVTEEDLSSAVFRISSMFAVACAVSKFKRAGSRHSSGHSTTSTTESSEPSMFKSRPFSASFDTPANNIAETRRQWSKSEHLVDENSPSSIPIVMSPIATMDNLESSPSLSSAPGQPFQASADTSMNSQDPVIFVSSPSESTEDKQLF